MYKLHRLQITYYDWINQVFYPTDVRVEYAFLNFWIHVSLPLPTMKTFCSTSASAKRACGLSHGHLVIWSVINQSEDDVSNLLQGNGACLEFIASCPCKREIWASSFCNTLKSFQRQQIRQLPLASKWCRWFVTCRWTFSSFSLIVQRTWWFKEIQVSGLIRRTDAEAPILWPPDA